MSSTVSVDRDAFGVLYSRHREEVLRYALCEPSPGPDLVVVRRSEESRRMQALASAWQECRRLNDDQRTCLRLRFLECMSVAQTAERMDRSEGAVKLLQHRATRLLRQHLLADACTPKGQ